jgi:hypothetical protein
MSPFKSKKAMLEIMKKFTNDLAAIGFKINYGTDIFAVNIDNDFVGELRCCYYQDRPMRRIIIRVYKTVKLAHRIFYNDDDMDENFEIKTVGYETFYITEKEVFALDSIKDRFITVYKNFKKAKDKVKELKMFNDFSA